MKLKPGKPQIITLEVGEEFSSSVSENTVPELKLRLEVNRLEDAHELSVTCNENPLKEGKLSEDWLEFALSQNQVVKGTNRFRIELRPNSTAEPYLLDLLLWVRY